MKELNKVYEPGKFEDKIYPHFYSGHIYGNGYDKRGSWRNEFRPYSNDRSTGRQHVFL